MLFTLQQLAYIIIIYYFQNNNKMVQNRILLILLMAWLSIQSSHLVHNCIHDQLEKLHPVLMPELEEPNQKDERRMLAGSPAFRISFDYSSLDTSITDATLKQYVIDLVNSARGFLEKRIKIKYPMTQNIVLTNPLGQCVQPFTAPAADFTAGIANSDFHYYITAENSDADMMAFATYCEFSITLQRPIAARLNFNLKYLTDPATDLSKDWKVWIDTTLHEMLHALAFDTRAFKYYRKASDNMQYGAGVYKNVTIRGMPTPVFAGELITQNVKDFFDCPDYSYIQMENYDASGTFGSHFERALFYDELMTASRMGYSKSFSLNSFIMLQETGWYDVDKRYPDLMSFGYKAGCKTVKYACQTPPVGETFNGGAPKAANLEYDFCLTPNNIGCAPDYTAKGSCLEKFPFADDCNLVQEYSNLQCIDVDDQAGDQDFPGSNQAYNIESRCFESSITGGLPVKCYNNVCNDDGSLTIIIGSLNVICTLSGDIKSVPGSSGTITCPDLTRFCGNRKKLCEGQCSHKGYCTGGVCTCTAGNAGYDCSITTCNSNEFYDDVAKSCVQTCPSSTFQNLLNQTCHRCHSTCGSCSDYGIHDCIGCQLNFLKEAGGCVSTCSSGYFLNTSQCDPCDTSCLTCVTNSVNCLTCKASQFLNGTVCVSSCPANKKVYVFKSQCVDTCPSTSFLDVNGVDCITCSTGQFMQANSCVATCNDGSYPKVGEQICAPCNSNCKTCSGGTSSECLSCNVGLNLQLLNCVATCAAGTFANTQVCSACPFRCVECSSNDICSICSEGYYLSSTSCLLSCPDRSFSNLETRTCDACNPECKTCKGLLSCQMCNDGKLLMREMKGIQCLDTCPDGYYNGNNVCLRCYGSCVTCSGGTNEDCLLCKSDLFTLGKKCLQECPADGYYGDSGACLKCNAACTQCTGGTAQHCTACPDTMYLIAPSKTCVSSCPTGSFQNDFLRHCWANLIIITAIINFVL